MTTPAPTDAELLRAVVGLTGVGAMLAVIPLLVALAIGSWRVSRLHATADAKLERHERPVAELERANDILARNRTLLIAGWVLLGTGLAMTRAAKASRP